MQRFAFTIFGALLGLFYGILHFQEMFTAYGAHAAHMGSLAEALGAATPWIGFGGVFGLIFDAMRWTDGAGHSAEE